VGSDFDDYDDLVVGGERARGHVGDEDEARDRPRVVVGGEEDGEAGVLGGQRLVRAPLHPKAKQGTLARGLAQGQTAARRSGTPGLSPRPARRNETPRTSAPAPESTSPAVRPRARWRNATKCVPAGSTTPIRAPFTRRTGAGASSTLALQPESQHSATTSSPGPSARTSSRAPVPRTSSAREDADPGGKTTSLASDSSIKASRRESRPRLVAPRMAWRTASSVGKVRTRSTTRARPEAPATS